MKYRLALMALILWLTPMAAAFAGPVVVHLAYLGQGHFQFKKKVYAYADLVQVVQAAYADEHIDQVFVDMGSVASQLDKAQVCPLRQGLQAPVRMFIIVEGKERTIFCN